MTRMILALSFTLVTVPTAHARSLCVQVDEGTNAGSLFVFQKVVLANQKAAPVGGYFAFFNQPGLNFSRFHPLHGGTMGSSPTRGFVLGITISNVAVGSGFTSILGTTQHAQVSCQDGLDDKLNVLDSCLVLFEGSPLVDGHVVDCKEAAPLIP